MKETKKRTSIGGQALMEGVMMRGPKKTAIAIRLENGDIVLEKWDNKVNNRHKFFKLPFVRGIFNFIDSMRTGYLAITRSAELSEIESLEQYHKAIESGELSDIKDITSKDDNEEHISLKNQENKKKADKEDGKDKKVTAQDAAYGMAAAVGAVLGTVLSVFLFIYLPTLFFNFIKKAVPAMDTRVMQSVCEGLIKIIIFLAYMYLMSLTKSMKRVFMYHGAEHKTIFCYEHEMDLTVNNVKKQSRFHPRCGTSFIVIMLIISIGIAMCIPHSIPTLLRVCIKILLLPITMGIGYEAIKLAGRKDNTFTKVMSAPGLWMQHISTKEPEEDYMIQCAIMAFNEVLPGDDSDCLDCK